MQFDTDDFKKIGKTVCVYGETGTGKTLDLSTSIPNATWILAKKNNLGSYNQWLENPNNKEAIQKYGLRMWDRLTIPEPPIRPEGYAPIEDLKSAVREIYNEIKEGRLASSCIVIDEFSVFVRRRYGSGGSYTIMPAVEADMSWFTAFAERSGLPMLLISHEAKPTYETEMGADPMSKKQGRLAEKGGPAIPFKKEREALGSSLDICLRRIVEHSGEASAYYWITRPVKEYWIKARADTWAKKESRKLGDLWRVEGWSFPTYKGVEDGKLKIVAPDPFLTT